MSYLSIKLGPESTNFFGHLRLLFGRMQQGISAEHRTEFARLDKEYSTYIQHLKQDSLEEFTFEVSESFYETWFHKVFKEAFSTYHKPRKGEAKAMNELYRRLNNNENNEDFLINYSRYWDDLN